MNREMKINIIEEDDGKLWVGIHGDFGEETISDMQQYTSEREAINQVKWALQKFSGAGEARRKHRYEGQ